MIYCAFPHFKLAESPAKHLDSHQAAPVFPNLAWHDQKIKAYAYEIHCGLVWPIVAYYLLGHWSDWKNMFEVHFKSQDLGAEISFAMHRKDLDLCWFVLLGVAGQIETAAETSVISFLLFLTFPYLIFPCFPFHFPCIQDISRPGPCKISARRALLSSFPHTRHFILQDKQWIGFNPGTSDPPKPHTKNLYNTCMIVYNHVMYGHTKESLCASIACKFAPVAALW